jgi:hypothetical protein
VTRAYFSRSVLRARVGRICAEPALGEAEPIHVHAVYSVLSEADLFFASLASIYEHVDGVTVITTYDRDWRGRQREPDDLVHRLLTRTDDPERKIALIVGHETNEARSRNRVMDFAWPVSKSRAVLRQHVDDRPLTPVDYFWIIDADEIYEASQVHRLLAHIAKERRPYYQVAARTYFKTWEFYVDGLEWFTAFVRADYRLGGLRNPRPRTTNKILNRLGPTGRRIADRLLGLERIPPDVGFFHHGSYVGPRTRIANKLRSSGHEHQIHTDWLERVWDTWTPESADFHPTTPSAFPRAVQIDRSELPQEIMSREWPEGYLD